MELLLIVIPSVLVAVAIVAGLDRAGMLPRYDESGLATTRQLHSIPRPVSLGMVLVLATWILAWLVLLGIGLMVILSAS